MMQEALGQMDGNPSSLHHDGRQAKQLIDLAREQVSNALGCLFGEVVFTSSGTEAANQAILGVAWAARDGSRKKVLLGATEHHCVLHCQEVLAGLGFQVVLIPANRDGSISVADVSKLLDEEVLMVSVMHGNNETGVINPVTEIAEVCRDAGALFHCDCVQTFPGYWTVDSIGADLVNVSAHKIHGPKGVGALYVRGGTKVKPLLVGGGQEREMRAGTENLLGIVGLGWATEEARAKIEDDTRSIARDAFLESVLRCSGVVHTVAGTDRPVLPGHAHLRSPGLEAEIVLIRLDREGVGGGSSV